MDAPHTCPLCTESYDERTDVRVHLEVEHRKSELAVFVLERSDDQPDPVVEDRPATPSA